MHQTDLDIRSRLAVARLPAMPQILLQLMEQCQTDDAGSAELAELIAKDAAMVSKILGVANSSAYHRRSQPLGLEQALITIGTDMVKTLLISESVLQIFDNFGESNGTSLHGFWKHSLAAAVTARIIAVKIGYPHSEEAYLAGMLHDIGRLALVAALPKEYAFNFLARDDEDLCAVEQRTLQITHTEAGAWLVERWNLDSFMADSVLYHHDPAARLENAHPLIRIVFLAHLLAGPEQDAAVLEAAGALCDIKAADLESIRARATEQVKKTAAYLGIDLSAADEPPAPPPPPPPPRPQDAARQKLTEQVRNMVLASEAGRSFAKQQGESELLETVARSARILFNFEDAAIFLTDDTGTALVGTQASSQRQRLAQFSITLASGGPIADAALQRDVTFVDRSSSSLSVAEEQLLRAFGTDGLVCLPLATDGQTLGVIIGGIAPWQVPDLRRRQSFMQAFCAQATTALNSLLGERCVSEADTVREEYRDASRRVAHEVNNPLSIIKNYLSVLDRKLARQEPVSGEVSILNEEIDRVGQIINGLADLQPASRDGTTEVGRVVNDVVRLFRDTEYVPPSVKIEARMQDQPFEIESDPDLLKQILLNLIKNAVEALSDGGEIAIVNNGFVNRDGALYVELWIRDTGPGISAEVMARLFAPVRSTKGDGHSGLGLSIVHGLVKQIRGQISCRSNGQGTTFELLLPVPSRADQLPAVKAQVKHRA